MCNKIKHTSHFAAIKHISSMKASRGGKYSTYYCAGCNSYHITSNTGSRTKFLKFKG